MLCYAQVASVRVESHCRLELLHVCNCSARLLLSVRDDGGGAGVRDAIIFDGRCHAGLSEGAKVVAAGPLRHWWSLGGPRLCVP